MKSPGESLLWIGCQSNANSNVKVKCIAWEHNIMTHNHFLDLLHSIQSPAKLGHLASRFEIDGQITVCHKLNTFIHASSWNDLCGTKKIQKKYKLL